VLPQIFVLLSDIFSRTQGPGKLAGELGFEPRSSVLETDSLTVELTPPWCGTRDEQPRSEIRRLLRFLVIRVLAAGIAELREFEAACGRLLILRRRVVPVFAIGALQCNNFAHLFILTDFTEIHTSPQNPFLWNIDLPEQASLPRLLLRLLT
jgi:hypothetical protein